MVKLLFEIEGVDINLRNFYDIILLVSAAKRGYKTIVKLFFKTKRVEVDLKDY